MSGSEARTDWLARWPSGRDRRHGRRSDPGGVVAKKIDMDCPDEGLKAFRESLDTIVLQALIRLMGLTAST